MSLDRINLIFHNKSYCEHVKKIQLREKTREFCKHDLKHFLDVARIAYIVTLEKNLKFPKDIVYAAALLHDIGRWKQYDEKIPHEEASAFLCEEILLDCGYKEFEIQQIKTAILEHRKGNSNKESLGNILYISDKKSRECYSCKAIKQCNWEEDEKNIDIIY